MSPLNDRQSVDRLAAGERGHVPIAATPKFAAHATRKLWLT
jgi:hypothetical protein